MDENNEDIVIPQNKEDLLAAEDLVFGRASGAEKVCPNCGMPLVGKSYYCMGCGRDVKADLKRKAEEEGTSMGSTYAPGSGYGGGNAYVEREKALQERRRKKRKRKLSDESGLAGFLLKLFGVLAGFLIGVFVLKWIFAPKDSSMILYREAKVTRIAGIKTIAAGTKTIPMGVVKDKRPGASDENPQMMTESSSQGTVSNGNIVKQKNQYFYGTLQISARDDKILSMEEEEVWDVSGLDPNDVAYVINHLNYLYEAYMNYIFIQYEIEQEEDLVTIRFHYRNLDLLENAVAMVRLGLFNRESIVEKQGAEYLSLYKSLDYLDEDGWREEMPIAMETPGPTPDAEETAAEAFDAGAGE